MTSCRYLQFVFSIAVLSAGHASGQCPRQEMKRGVLNACSTTHTRQQIEELELQNYLGTVGGLGMYCYPPPCVARYCVARNGMVVLAATSITTTTRRCYNVLCGSIHPSCTRMRRYKIVCGSVCHTSFETLWYNEKDNGDTSPLLCVIFRARSTIENSITHDEGKREKYDYMFRTR